MKIKIAVPIKKKVWKGNKIIKNEKITIDNNKK